MQECAVTDKSQSKNKQQEKKFCFRSVLCWPHANVDKDGATEGGGLCVPEILPSTTVPSINTINLHPGIIKIQNMTL